MFYKELRKKRTFEKYEQINDDCTRPRGECFFVYS